MKTFVYEGLKNGRKVRGKIEGNSKSEVFRKLKGEGIIPLSISEVSKKKNIFDIFRKEIYVKKPSEEELSFILLQLSILLQSGIPLAKALELVASQTQNQRISHTLLEIKNEIEKGVSISEAFRRSGIFPEFLSHMLTSAETGENLEKIFEIAGKHLETIADMKSKIINSVTYPSVVIAFSLIALFIAVKFVVPKIAGVLEGFGKELPFVTELIIFFSDILTYIFYSFPLFLILFLFRRRFISDTTKDKLLLKLPVIGKISYFFNLSRFAYTLYMTLSSAVPVTSAFRIASNSITNSFIRNKLLELTKEIERGRSLSSVLRSSGVFPELFINLVETGENSGELERMLNLLAEIYRKNALRQINLWIRMIEPLSILLIGIIVGIIVISVLLPLTEITTGIRR